MRTMELNRNKSSIQRTHLLLLGIASTAAPSPLLLCTAFLTPPPPQHNAFRISPTSTSRTPPLSKPLYIYAPPGSGYIDSEDDIPNHPIPETYKPTMGYPGTMRPGETKENQPYSSLPIADNDPDPVPWPHFQEIEWHHNWGSPHEHPIPMEEFIDMNGRWATVEMEAEVRKGARRGLRERREMEESQKTASFILDDDDDDDDDVDGIMGAAGSTGVKLDLGEGMDVDLMIGSEMGTGGSDGAKASGGVVDADVEEEEVDDDFLLSLGLDSDDDDDSVDDDDDDDDDDLLLSLGIENDDDDDDDDVPADGDDDGLLDVMQSMLDADDDTDDADDSDDDFDADGDQMVPLDDMIGNEDMGDDDAFDDGGFDYD